MSERRADEATRDVVNWLKCEFMKDRVGESVPGVITAVTGFGLFVELTDIYVEGLVHVTALPGDYYHFDPVHHRLAGERTGRSFRLGDTVEVQVMRVDLDERKIDFGMPDKPAEAPGSRKKRGSEATPASKGKGAPAKAKPAATEPAPAKPGRRSSTKEKAPEAYRPSDAAAKNAELRKSRELKQQLLNEAKSGGKAASGGKSQGAEKPSSKPSKHRKGPPKAGSAPAKSGGSRKPKAKP
jgi:ribonuclease R